MHYEIRPGIVVKTENAAKPESQSSALLRRFGAKPRKNFVDDQAASPSSWKTPRMAVWMAA